MVQNLLADSSVVMMMCVCLQESGLSLWVAELLTPLGDLPVLATITIACIIVTTVTEVASNAATITIFLPILSPLVGSQCLMQCFCFSRRFYCHKIIC